MSNVKTVEQRRKEFLEQVRKTTESSEPKGQDDEPAKAAAEKAAADENAKEEERPRENERVQPVTEAEEEKAKASEQAEVKTDAKKADADAEAATAAATAAETPEKKAGGHSEEDEELERIIREMEEEDARREKEQAELTAKKKVKEEEAKKRAEEQRLASAAENDRKLREQEREMERLEEERERQRKENEAKAAASGKVMSVTEALAEKIDNLKLSDTPASTPGGVADKPANPNTSGDDDTPSGAAAKSTTVEKRTKPAALNLASLNTKPVEAPQPSAALQSLKSARFLEIIRDDIYPAGIASPNPALNAAVAKKGKTFKYDAQFLLQFQKVFTEQPSVEFHQQVKSLLGDSDGGSRSASTRTPGPGSGRQNSRSGAPGFPAMGQFATGAKPLPPGTTSAERFAMSQGSLPRPGMNPMAFGRPGAFPAGSQMTRTPSSTNMNIPNSPRQGSRSARGSSKRDNFNAKAEAQAAKTMPLTQGMEVRPITISSSGWKSTSVGNKAVQAPTAVVGQGGPLDPEIVQRKVKAALNKMTPEKFDKISDQILAIAGQSKSEQDGRTLRQVIQLTFEKATDEAHWASMYAKFCKRMLEMMSPEIRDENILDKAGNVVSGGALFRKYLLNRCQEEFERGWKVDLPKPKEGEAGEAAMLSDEYYIAAAAKRRGLGLVQFIGELYKLGMLTERIMHECVRKLLEFEGIPDEAEIESLTKLLRTIGANLDSTEKGKPMMDAYFKRIGTIIDLPDLPSRLKFMLMDIVDLRKNGWVSKEANKGPKTLEEVRAEVCRLSLRDAVSSTNRLPG
jgi:translation initiation factor 4G